MIPAGLKARARPGESAGAGGGLGPVSAVPPPCPASAAFPSRHTASQAGGGVIFSLLQMSGIRSSTRWVLLQACRVDRLPALLSGLVCCHTWYFGFCSSTLVFAFIFTWCLPVCLRPNSLLCQDPGHIRTCCCLCCQVASDSVTPWTAAHQAPLSMVFPRQEYWNGLPFPPAVDLPHAGTEPVSPELRADSVTTELPGKPSYQARVHLF